MGAAINRSIAGRTNPSTSHHYGASRPLVGGFKVSSIIDLFPCCTALPKFLEGCVGAGVLVPTAVAVLHDDRMSGEIVLMRIEIGAKV